MRTVCSASASEPCADASEERGVRHVLTAAALTYVVGLFDRLGYFLALLFIAEVMRRYADGSEAVLLITQTL